MAKNFRIPSHAKKVFSGIIFDVYQWEQKLFDGSSTTFEKAVRPDLSIVIPVTQDNKIILLEEVQPGTKKYLTFPGGRLEKGEDPKLSAERELLEETGFKAEKIYLWSEEIPPGHTNFFIRTYIAKGCKKVTKPNLDPGEKINLKKVTFDEFLKIVQDNNFIDISVANKVMKALLNSKELERLRSLLLES